jgi:hypothetical protein
MRRNGRDERRRRVLRDEPSSGEQRPERSVRADRDNPYQESARSERQHKILDLVPRRSGIILILFLLQLTVLAALQALHWSFFEDASALDRAWLSYFDITRAGGLASWYESVVFATLAMFCGVLYSVRRHRRDDFQGRYRSWAWLAGVWLLLSANATTGFERFAGETAERLAPQVGLLQGVNWSAMQWAAVLLSTMTVVVTARMWFEFRESYATSLWVVMALLTYAVGSVHRQGWLPAGYVSNEWIAASCDLLGVSFLSLSFLVYTRFVVRDAHGEITRRPRTAETAAAAASSTPAAESEGRRKPRTIAQPAGPSPAATQVAAGEGGRESSDKPSVRIQRDRIARPASNAAADDTASNTAAANTATDDVDDEFESDLSDEELAELSKADRRRLRKQQRKGRRAA